MSQSPSAADQLRALMAEAIPSAIVRGCPSGGGVVAYWEYVYTGTGKYLESVLKIVRALWAHQGPYYDGSDQMF